MIRIHINLNEKYVILVLILNSFFENNFTKQKVKTHKNNKLSKK